MSAKLCIMTAYADETRILLDILGQEVGDSIDWNSRLQFERSDGNKKIVDVCAINNVKYVGIRVISDLCIEEDSGPIPKERIERLRISTTAYVNALVDFNKC